MQGQTHDTVKVPIDSVDERASRSLNAISTSFISAILKSKLMVIISSILAAYRGSPEST